MNMITFLPDRYSDIMFAELVGDVIACWWRPADDFQVWNWKYAYNVATATVMTTMCKEQ
jgi:hypothetical protein